MKIGIVGLGLIGGSIYKSLKSKNYDVVGISDSQNGLYPDITNDYNILKECNIVFVASPMNKVLEILDKIEDIVSEKTIVADVSSLKSFVCKKQYKYNFIPTHPMAGTEKTGFENSFKELFDGAKWVICKNDCPEILQKAIMDMGAEIIYATPEEHDEAVALISHMPMVVSQAIFNASRDNVLAMRLASSGFRDMTRLAITNSVMAEDMINFNHENIQDAVLKMYSSIGELLKTDYKEKVEEISKARSAMYKNGKNIL